MNSMEREIKELKNLAFYKKNTIKYKMINSFINGDYKFKISGIGQKSIKLELYLNYKDILLNKNNNSIEKRIYNKLMETF